VARRWRVAGGTASAREPLRGAMASKSLALEYVDDQGPGITRKKAGHGWAYFDPDGKRITDRDEIDRLNRIA
jgi:DNA topoisomerase-1